MPLHEGSRARLTPRTAERFPADTLFDRVARALCAASCLPRRELFESWEVARRVRRRFRGGRVVDLACGHGLLAHLLLLLDDSSPGAIAADVAIPPCAGAVAAALAEAWPRLAGRVELRTASLEAVPLAAGDLVVSVHACGDLSDVVLARAVAASARVAILPCCQRLRRPLRDPLEGWLDGPLAVDVGRATRLLARGWTVHTSRIPGTITAKDRLLMAAPWPSVTP